MKKIFVAHRASIGDTLLGTPTLRAIKETYPNSRTIMMASPSSKDILEEHPYIDDLILYKKGDNIFPIIKKIWRADLALILDYHYRSSLFAWIARIPIRIGRGNKKKSFLTEQVPENYSYNLHATENTLNVARYVGINTKDMSLIMATYKQEEKVHVRQLLSSNTINLDRDKFIVIAPYSLADIKDWPEEYYQQLIDWLVKDKYKIILVGGAEHYERAKVFKNSINLVGKTNIRETTYLISIANLVICGCTSVLHFAATTQTPQVAIYGPTIPQQWAPRKNCTVISKGLECSPCYNLNKQCYNNRMCINSILPGEVYEKVKSSLLLSN